MAALKIEAGEAFLEFPLEGVSPGTEIVILSGEGEILLSSGGRNLILGEDQLKLLVGKISSKVALGNLSYRSGSKVITQG